MNGATAIAPGGPAPPGAVVSKGRRRFSAGLVFATLFLIFAGAEVKSRQAGLSVPDWPLSYGMWWPPMVGNVFYEHGHRTIAAIVGLLTTILALWTARVEARPWVRKLAWFALGAVILQGLLGGLTVKLLLPPAVSVGHALLAQTFVCIVAWLAYAGSREWRDATPRLAPAATKTATAVERDHAPARAAMRATVWAAGAVYVQLLLGALMRHTESGLAVPFFPLSESGSLLPDHIDHHVVLHMLHRGFAFVVLAFVLTAAVRLIRSVPKLRLHATVLALVVLGQVALGVTVIWTAGVHPSDGTTPMVSPVPTSLHVMTGALLLVLAWLAALRCWRAGNGASS
jgi:cytochrome c oxidase assembly protein subunit 15